MLKNTHIWLADYIRGRLLRPSAVRGEKHVMFCLADHFEPRWGNVSLERERSRVRTWCRKYPAIALQHRDSDGVSARHTIFYPEEEYRAEHLEILADVCSSGIAEVEVHLHHRADTPENLCRLLERFKTVLDRHGLLSRDPLGEIRYGFIHGDWALDNSRKDGLCCGVNNELQVLRDTGCYADFTLPSAPSDTQTAKVNSIYYACDDPEKPKSHNRGIDVCLGAEPTGDLMIVQGPLALNWRFRKAGILPRIENGNLTSENLSAPGRADIWARQGISVAGRPEWIFIKVHTHGLQDANLGAGFFEGLDRLYGYLENKYMSGGFNLHYVTAREMYNIIKAAEAGEEGSPGLYRDYRLKRSTGEKRSRPREAREPVLTGV